MSITHLPETQILEWCRSDRLCTVTHSNGTRYTGTIQVEFSRGRIGRICVGRRGFAGYVEVGAFFVESVELAE